MDSKEPLKTRCTELLQHGFVLDENCKQCEYFCLSPYKSSSERYVECDATSGKWLTRFGEEPCMRSDAETTTKKMFDFNPNVPASNPFNYQNNIDLNNYRTYKPLDLDIPTYKSWDDLKIPTVQPYSFEDHVSDDEMNNNSPYKNEMNSGAVFGLIVAGIIGMMVLVIFVRVWVARCAASRRRQRIQHLVEQMNSQIRHTGDARTQRGAPPRSPAERTDNETENEEGGGIIIVRIRRFLRIPLPWNPYNAFRNPPEPPPYDAESVLPPAYEETEGDGGSTTETHSQPDEVGFRGSTDTQADPPPPYTANLV